MKTRNSLSNLQIKRSIIINTRYILLKCKYQKQASPDRKVVITFLKQVSAAASVIRTSNIITSNIITRTSIKSRHIEQTHTLNNSVLSLSIYVWIMQGDDCPIHL